MTPGWSLDEPTVTDIKVIKYTYVIQIKLKYDSYFIDLSTRKTRRANNVISRLSHFTPLYKPNKNY